MKAESFVNLAKYYDLLYQDKDYLSEMNFIESFFKDHAVKSVLELGCGTGNYTKVLFEKGYGVTGVDLSENMLDVAKHKCACKFVNSDIRTVSLNETFDVCLAMFAVMGYITETTSIIHTFENVYKHLKPGGLFIFDVWNGLAVMRLLPDSRLKTVQTPDVKLLRFAQPVLRSADQICEVNYKLLIFNKKSGGTCEEIDEKHIVRFYFPQETKYYLEQAGFEVLKICPFMGVDSAVDENVWNMVFVARTRSN